MENRSVRRYQVAFPVTFFWGSGTNFFEGIGTTRDLSVRGLFIVTTEVVPCGCDLFLKVALPPIREGAAGSEMQGNGRVIRTQDDGFAAEAVIGFSTEFKSKRKDTTKRDHEGGDGAETTATAPIGVTR